MNTTRRRTLTAPVVLLLAIGVAATACVGYDPRDYDGDVPSHLTSGGTPTPTEPTTAGGPGSGSHIVLVQAAGDDVTVDVADASGTLLEATSGTPGDGASVEPGQLHIVNDDPMTLRLTWTGGPCATADLLLIDAARRSFVLGQRGCAGDSIVTDRVLVLRFAEPITAAEVEGRVADGLGLGS
jgi:hypothetical protein